MRRRKFSALAVDANGLVFSILASICTPIVSYAAKHASALYEPFRDASMMALGGADRRAHQVDPANRRDGVREALRDRSEGVDGIIVKPGGWFGDVIAGVRGRADIPVWAYQVSGEYAMIEAAAERGWLDREAAALESLVSLKRAGADRIISYYADRVPAWLDGRRAGGASEGGSSR